ncbi:carbohydrate ABC transporter permease [Bifidobacterium crudilactis]|jgi:raffinose/stachyose/melibiose transport system permease protein|uniref:carbohydrate ABC transporter permease n=1 Tax=Bifidobacterium crudilactis TaxID=327277 RepID=UPI000690FD0F|nr:sugar ABC transporter permease [Bifidobacterium crudilactis]MCI1217401.1 sugar ABC transporter permease [Bifidobacterium crudilactis]MCI1636512.1 sugar ABC transporter permease [Bifidobacterium crudilactis]MCI2148446.1 sugar ABC transporter permease [Bifidobacterium crudilactis]MCI2157141.1 sugar ABC transporter permease [Bifidobacterium crudilactis]
MNSTRNPAARKSGRRPLHGAGINLFYVPALLILILFTVWPLLSGIQLSFTNWDGYSPTKLFVGLSNYVTMFKDHNFATVLVNTLIYGVGSTIVQQVIGLALALLLNTKIKGRNIMRAVIYLPALVSAVIMGTMYYFVFQYQQGALNTMMVALGLPRVVWFDKPAVSVAIIVIVNSLQYVGVSMIIYLAGLQGMDQSVVEAADLDGAYGWKKFKSITLPLLMPAFSTSVVLNLIGGLKLFDVIQVLTGGGPGYSTNSVSTYIGLTYFSNQNAGYASAMGVVLFIIIAIATTLLNKGLDRLGWES